MCSGIFRRKPYSPKWRSLLPTDTPAAAPAEPDEETIGAFTALLEKIGPAWLEKLTTAQKPSPSSDAPKQQVSNDLAAFLQSALEKTEKARDKLASDLEAIRDLLTPEQLTLLRSQRSGAADAKKDTSGVTLKEPPTPPEPKPKPRKW